MRLLPLIAAIAVGIVVATSFGCRTWGGPCQNGNCAVPYTPSYGQVQPAPLYSQGGSTTTIQGNYPVQNPSIQPGGGYGYQSQPSGSGSR